MSGGDVENYNLYYSVFKEKEVLYNTLPWWRPLKRANVYAEVRQAYAGCIGAGHSQFTIAMPKPVRQRIWEGFRGWLPLVSTLTGIVVVCILMLWGFVAVIDASDKGDEPLPKYITQRGAAFLIAPGYASQADSGEWTGIELCDRLPGDFEFDDETDERPDGTLIIKCKEDD